LLDPKLDRRIVGCQRFRISLLFLQYIVHIIQKIITLRRDEVGGAAKRFELKEIEITEADPSPQKQS